MGLEDIMVGVISGGFLVLVVLIMVIAFLYHFGGKFISRFYKRTEKPSEREIYVFESKLALINLAMTVLLNVALGFVFLLCGVVLLYAFMFLPGSYLVPLIVVVGLIFLATLVVCVKLIIRYNK